MDRCPIARWKEQQPNSLAIRSKHFSLTYAELDQLIKELTPVSFIPTTPQPTPEQIALFFAAWRHGKPVYPLSFRLPESEKKKRYAITQLEGDLLLDTSGTTGDPKIVCHSLESLFLGAKEASQALSLTPDDRYCLNLPLSHISGIAIALRTFLTGATLLLPDLLFEATHLSLVPTQLYRFLKANQLPSARCLLIGGAPLPPHLFQEGLYLTYGMTETGAMATLNPNARELHAGKPLPHIELKLSPEGEILLRGESLFQNYLGQEKRKPGDWFPTNDLGKLTPDGNLEVLGRKDRQFISGGENIQPEVIEKALLSIPNILEAKVSPAPHPEFGMTPIAHIQATAPLSLETIHAQLADLLPRYQIPKKITLETNNWI